MRVWVNQIFGLAIGKGMTENNPASNLIDIAEKAPEESQYPHLLESELPEFLRAMGESRSGTIVRTAAWLTLLTASRPGMTRWAEWTEVDLDAGLWTVPGVKMKMRRDHIVPLPTQAVELIRIYIGLLAGRVICSPPAARRCRLFRMRRSTSALR